MDEVCTACGGHGLVYHDRTAWQSAGGGSNGYEATVTHEDWCACVAGESAKFEHETRWAVA